MPFFITTLAVLALVFIGSRLFTSKNPGKYSQAHNQEKELLRLCMGDQEQAVRLTLHELKRNPALSHSQAVRAAVQAYKRDS